jgi:dienelactone hydrolase
MGEAMQSFLALIAFLTQAALHVETVKIPEPDGTVLQAALVVPAGPPRGPAVVALHGCGGPFPTRDGPWAQLLAEQGHVVLLPDSFGTRGLGSQCNVRDRTVRASVQRRGDAIAAAKWLAARPGTPAGGVVLMGWSNGGNTTLYTAEAGRADLPPGLFRAFVAFYPGCNTLARRPDWRPAAPMLILNGASDDWTPAAGCQPLADRLAGLVTVQIYPDAYHDFDALNKPVTVRRGAAFSGNGDGNVHTGTNEAARADARTRVPAFIAAH